MTVQLGKVQELRAKFKTKIAMAEQTVKQKDA